MRRGIKLGFLFGAVLGAVAACATPAVRTSEVPAGDWKVRAYDLRGALGSTPGGHRLALLCDDVGIFNDCGDSVVDHEDVMALIRASCATWDEERFLGRTNDGTAYVVYSPLSDHIATSKMLEHLRHCRPEGSFHYDCKPHWDRALCPWREHSVSKPSPDIPEGHGKHCWQSHPGLKPRIIPSGKGPAAPGQ